MDLGGLSMFALIRSGLLWLKNIWSKPLSATGSAVVGSSTALATDGIISYFKKGEEKLGSGLFWAIIILAVYLLFFNRRRAK